MTENLQWGTDEDWNVEVCDDTQKTQRQRGRQKETGWINLGIKQKPPKPFHFILSVEASDHQQTVKNPEK